MDLSKLHDLRDLRESIKFKDIIDKKILLQNSEYQKSNEDAYKIKTYFKMSIIYLMG